MHYERIFAFILFVFPVKIFSFVPPKNIILHSKVIMDSSVHHDIVYNQTLSLCIEANIYVKRNKKCKIFEPGHELENFIIWNKDLIVELNMDWISLKNGYKFILKYLSTDQSENTYKSDEQSVNHINKFPFVKHIPLLMNSDSFLSVSITYTCGENFYGPHCKNFCKPSDNDYGHYNCTKLGKKVCLPGWIGTFCNQAYCESCNNGICVTPGKCRCSSGYDGPSCNWCANGSKCKHGSCRQNIQQPNSSRTPTEGAVTPHTFDQMRLACICNPGWGGQNCDIDIKYCASNANICKNEGKCRNFYGKNKLKYICECEPGYTGRHCEIKTGECRFFSHDRKNLTNVNRVECKCYRGYSGSFCHNYDIFLNHQNKANNLKSDGFCMSHRFGYSCTCKQLKLSRKLNPVKVCQCRFIKCLSSNSFCDDSSDNGRIFCFDNGHNESTYVSYHSNFYLDKHHMFHRINDIARNSVNESGEVTNTSQITGSPPIPPLVDYGLQDYRNNYLIFVVMPLLIICLMLIIAVAVCKYKLNFFRKSRRAACCIKTIHNDLGLFKATIIAASPSPVSDSISKSVNQSPIKTAILTENHTLLMNQSLKLSQFEMTNSLLQHHQELPCSDDMSRNKLKDQTINITLLKEDNNKQSYPVKSKVQTCSITSKENKNENADGENCSFSTNDVDVRTISSHMKNTTSDESLISNPNLFISYYMKSRENHKIKS